MRGFTPFNMASPVDCRLRLAVNCASWLPLKEEWLAAISRIQREERERVVQFAFRRDAKFALVGRLLLRAALVQGLNTSNSHIQLGRSERGRPCLVKPDSCRKSPSVDFNVSHQGQFAVLACEMGRQVGVDVMQLTRPRGQSVPRFFQTMNRQFTAHEWDQIRRAVSEQEQLAMFYRFWCLKESFIKAEGSGLSYGLQRLEFTADSSWPPPDGGVCSSSELRIDGAGADGWIFEESLVDCEHCVAVALGTSIDGTRNDGPCPSWTPLPFTLVTVKHLMNNLLPLEPASKDYWSSYEAKPCSPNAASQKVGVYRVKKL